MCDGVCVCAGVGVWCRFNVKGESHSVSVQTDVSVVTAGIPSTSANSTCSKGARRTDTERGRERER